MAERYLNEQIARAERVPLAEAADRVDEAVTKILLKVRAGGSARVPGFGTFFRKDGRLRFKPEAGR